MKDDYGFCKDDINVLRVLAKKVKVLSQTDKNFKRINDWTDHNDLKGSRPMIIVEIFRLAKELDALMPLVTKSDLAREIESDLRLRLLQQECNDDSVITDDYKVHWEHSASDYGFKLNREKAKDGIAFHYYPVSDSIDEILDMFKMRTYSLDMEKTLNKKLAIESVIGDILKVKTEGCHYWWSMGMTETAISFLGMENYMLCMYDSPEKLKSLMRLLTDDNIKYLKWLEAQGGFTPNNYNDAIGSGGFGFTQCLSSQKPAKLKDMWVLLESQETVGISTDFFAEFVFPYQKEISELFGLTYYGCCEPLDNRMQLIKQIKNLRSVSVSPWANQKIMAKQLEDKYIFSRKPSPSMLSGVSFNEQIAIDDLCETIKYANLPTTEIIMKDLHTTQNDFARVKRWIQIARKMTNT